jgi:hypothetical protein
MGGGDIVPKYALLPENCFESGKEVLGDHLDILYDFLVFIKGECENIVVDDNEGPHDIAGDSDGGKGLLVLDMTFESTKLLTDDATDDKRSPVLCPPLFGDDIDDEVTDSTARMGSVVLLIRSANCFCCGSCC